jgi:hypothetical protein
MSALFGSRMNYLRRVRVIPSRWFLLLIILTALAPRCLSQKPGHGGSTFRLSELVGVPAVATVRVSCCGDRQSLLSGINYILKSSTGIPIHHESEDQ